MIENQIAEKFVHKWLLCIIFALIIAVPDMAYAWDGVVTGKILFFQTAPAGNMAFRVTLEGSPVMCNGGGNFAFIDMTDPNYQGWVSGLTTAWATNSNITIYSSTNSSGYCLIGFIQVSH